MKRSAHEGDDEVAAARTAAKRAAASADSGQQSEEENTGGAAAGAGASSDVKPNNGAVARARSAPGGPLAQPLPTAPFAAAAAASHKGRRAGLEDRHVVCSDTQLRATGAALPKGETFGLLAVIDGHGGRAVADCVADHLPGAVARALAALSFPAKKAQVKTAVRTAFAETDSAVTSACAASNWTDGACVCAVVIVGRLACVANLGDCKVVLCRRTADAPAPADGVCKLGLHDHACACPALPPCAAKALTVDHTPLLASERERIEAAGGTVSDGRVNGVQAVSRSFGDVALKKFGVSSDPDIRVAFRLTDKDEFFLLACDGLWSRHTAESAVQFVRRALAARRTTEDAPAAVGAVCTRTVHHAVEKLGVTDNVTVLVATLTAP